MTFKAEYVLQRNVVHMLLWWSARSDYLTHFSYVAFLSRTCRIFCNLCHICHIMAKKYQFWQMFDILFKSSFLFCHILSQLSNYLRLQHCEIYNWDIKMCEGSRGIELTEIGMTEMNRWKTKINVFIRHF